MSIFTEYVNALQQERKTGSAGEHAYRPALKALLESVAKGIVATNDPKRIACGAPDFQITRKGVPLGHIETKDIGADLDEIERGKGSDKEQFARYCAGLPNWLFTDYLEFRWFVAGEKRLTARVADVQGKGTNTKIRILPSALPRLNFRVKPPQLAAGFLDGELPIDAPLLGVRAGRP
ncbi:MAG: hypothetical protein ABSG86_20745, partial [Thermoguttaceae bacterium]